jgi:hypothetical protein
MLTALTFIKPSRTRRLLKLIASTRSSYIRTLGKAMLRRRLPLLRSRRAADACDWSLGLSRSDLEHPPEQTRP